MRVGILTGGGDCPGLNAVIRAAVRAVAVDGPGEAIGFHDAWRGVLENRWEPLSIDRCRGILPRGGTILGTSRDQPYQHPDGVQLVADAVTRHRLDAIIAVGGEGSMGVVDDLHRDGIPVVGVPKTIDNDIPCTEMTFGFQTAVQICTDAIDRLHTTAESHQRVLLVEVMGRHAGWIALNAGLATGAHLTLVPEHPFDVDDVCALVQSRFARGATYVIAVVAEGATPRAGSMALRQGGTDEYGHQRFTGVAQQLGAEIERRIGKEVRTTVLGHVQRGGTPTPFDRVLATRFGLHAVTAAQQGHCGQMVALHGTEIELVPLAEAVRTLRTVTPARLAEAATFFG